MSMQLGYKLVKRIVIFIIGFTMLIIGVSMIVLPGPAIIMIPLSLGVLATEFVWAKRWLRKYEEHASSVTGELKKRVWDRFFKPKDKGL